MASSVPQFYSNYSFSNNFSRFQHRPLLNNPQENCIDSSFPSSASCGDEELSFPMFPDDFGLDVFQQEPNLTTSSLIPTADDNNNNNVVVCGIDGRYDDQFGEDFKPLDLTMAQNRGVHGNLMVPVTEDDNRKAFRYTVEERKERIVRYLKKRNQRNFNKTIKYACRKSIADRRVRVRGRFASNNTEQCEEERLMKKEDDYPLIDKNLKYYCDVVKVKHDEDEWLQEAMANLIYSP